MKVILALAASGCLLSACAEKRDFIEFLPSCKRHYQDPKLQARDWDRAWTIRDERFNHVTNLFLDIEHPETFPRELFDSASSAGAVHGCFGWGKRALDPRFADDVEPSGDPDEKPAKLGVRRVESDRRADENAVRFDFNREQLAELEDHISGRAPLPRGAAEQAYDGHLLVAPWEKTPFDVVCRRIGAALDARARKGEDVSAFRRELDALRSRTTASARDALDACALRRRVLFSDPAVKGMGPLMFLARATYAGSRLTNPQNSDATGGHFATQCYAFNTVRGGGLFRVDGWRGEAGGEVRDLLAGCVVTNGPLAGKTLAEAGGCFYSFDLDYDGKTLYFTHARPKMHRWIWDESTTWKIFRLDVATGKIAQITFGNTNDFDPAVLPGGRVVFSSERRGGFIRCFTKEANLRVPVFMLHSMKPDGRDIYPISFYETSEWQASVGNDGMLVYTRWDYTDRDDCLGSRFWICYPDGRDPRAPHGNYPFPWHTFADNTHGYHVYGSCADAPSGLPMTEMGIRAIPGSHEYILTASPHHGESFGSICRLDIRIQDDHHMGQLKRLTPFVKFPESESAARAQYEYGTPWPVDDNLYFCTRWEDVVLRDRFGNEELVVAREQLPCGYDPRLRLTHLRPLAPRPRPPVITQQTTQGEDFAGKRRPAVVSVVDVRQSDIPFPTNRVPTRLRVLQAIVKPDPWMDVPMVGYEPENCPRIPLGTVPIEADGSCRFVCPAGKQLIFQVLDEQGAAIQSMRSTAFAHTGESLTCVGCHEPHQGTAVAPARPPKAFARPPSKLEPEGVGVEPITFARLVKPVFAKCQACHEKAGKGPKDFSYEALRSLTFHFNGGFGGSIMKKDTGGSRSIPGRMGAANCALGKALLGDAHRARVSEADRRRVTLWLDANSLYYGAFYDFEAQKTGERIVWPVLDVDPDNPLADCE